MPKPESFGLIIVEGGKMKMRKMIIACVYSFVVLSAAPTFTNIFYGCSAEAFDGNGGQATATVESTPEGTKAKTQVAVNESRAMAALIAVAKGEVLYRLTAGNKRRSYATLRQLTAAGMIEPGLGGRDKHGYRFSVRLRAGRKSFEAVATPVAYATTGIRSFYIDQRVILRGGDKKGRQATASDHPINPPR
jgi:hypothetical protein